MPRWRSCASVVKIYCIIERYLGWFWEAEVTPSATMGTTRRYNKKGGAREPQAEGPSTPRAVWI